MNMALNLMNSGNTTVNDVMDNSKTGVDFSGNNRIEKRDFKEILLSNPVSKKNSQNEESLKKLKELLEMNSEDLEKVLKELDRKTLMELEGLLNLSFEKLLEKIIPLIENSGFNKEKIGKLEDSIKELKTALVQVLAENKEDKDIRKTQQDNKDTNKTELGKTDSGKVNNRNTGDNSIITNTSTVNKNESTDLEVELFSKNAKSDIESKTGDIEKNLSNLDKKKNLDSTKKNGSRNIDELFTNNPTKTANTKQSISEGLQRENLNELFKEVSTKKELTLGNVEIENLDNKDDKFSMNLNKTLDAIADSDLSTSKGQLTQNGENGQFNDLMGQGSGYDSSVEGTNAAKMSVPSGSDMSGIIEQITERMQLQQQQGKNQINLQLEPEALGKVRIRLQLENNQLTARLVVENNQVKGYLEQNLPGLKSNLIRQGFNIEQIQLDSNQADYSDQSNSQQKFQEQGQYNQEHNPEKISQFNYEEIDSLFSEEEISELPESIITDHRWSHINYIRHRMNFLA